MKLRPGSDRGTAPALTVRPDVEILIRDRRDPTFSKSRVWAETANIYGAPTFSKCRVWAERINFYGESDNPDDILLIGYDTEYKTPPDLLRRSDVRAGEAKNTVLSYQAWCKVRRADGSSSPEWGGICYPPPGRRLTFGEFLTFAIRQGIASGAVKSVPRVICLTGHFTRADFPAFADFQLVLNSLDAVRNTFMTVSDAIKVDMDFGDGEPPVGLAVSVRDTIALTPAASKGLAALGALVGQPKIVLDPDPEKELWWKQNMDVLLMQKPDLFEQYALNDAVICVRYIERFDAKVRELVGKPKQPATLGGLGVDLLQADWKARGWKPHTLLGKEEHVDKWWSTKAGRYRTKKEYVLLAEVHSLKNHATECYHGGRNEQYWFGPGFEADWTDYDLAGAYPTAMSLLRTPDWRAIYTTTDLDAFTDTTFGIASVEFEHPEHILYPVLPVRTANGLIFPRKGISYCAAPEIAVARRLGVKLKIKLGVMIPYADDELVFGGFIRTCTANRKSYEKGTLEELLWKELTNSVYGKTAQGLHDRRVYDLRDRRSKRLPASKITNPYYAAFITSAVRGVLAEIMNGLPPSACVFNCTTDGFLTTATEEEIAKATSGPLASKFAEARRHLTGEAKVVEIKRKCRRPLGWRTRGQATMIPGDSDRGDDFNHVLAKGGIKPAACYDEVVSQNAYIRDLFLNRTPEDELVLEVQTSVRDMVEYDADLVGVERTKRLSMEFDWKRRPISVGMASDVGHIAFSTGPWNSLEDFESVRGRWDAMMSQQRFCMKTLEDFERFAFHVFTTTSLGSNHARYMRKEGDPDVQRLRQSLCAAWHVSAAGVRKGMYGLSARGFAEALTNAGIPCTRAHVENGTKKPKNTSGDAFQPHRCPRTPAVQAALGRLRLRFPEIQPEVLLAEGGAGIDMLQAMTAECPFTSR